MIILQSKYLLNTNEQVTIMLKAFSTQIIPFSTKLRMDPAQYTLQQISLWDRRTPTVLKKHKKGPHNLYFV